MEPLSREEEHAREVKATHKLTDLGWMPVGDWKFSRNGKVYDLSAADLEQLDLIEARGLFVVG